MNHGPACLLLSILRDDPERAGTLILSAAVMYSLHVLDPETETPPGLPPGEWRDTARAFLDHVQKATGAIRGLPPATAAAPSTGAPSGLRLVVDNTERA